MVSLAPHIVYSNSVQHHLHSDFLRILNPYSVYLFASYSLLCNIEALCIHSCSINRPIDRRL
ncbi:hypothetical protein PILCRDRAFT_498300 [Piloderma croceum F 1598]|uniref:Uncharacterized protein n=1 Tax=Piloderma croceum (strain F 1598) TaxID=765440 RepID=A0A0C3FPL2_PILCF|nr:hypothetical protein PILCRDRAFT_498300 [Piloderma croceum F 1598]